MVLARLKRALSFFSYSSAGNSSGIFKLYATMKYSPGGPGLTRGIRNPLNDLYRRISPISSPKDSIVPILDQWIQEGRTVNYDGLLNMIKELRFWKRYTHALEVSMWMTRKRYFELQSRDFSIRLDLIARVHGIEEAESYFNNIPTKLRTFECYSSLLNCYVRIRNVEKAETIMQKMGELGFAWSVISYNTLLNLYYQTQNHDKAENLVREMQYKGINFDNFTFGTLLTAYAATSNIEGMDKLLTQLESDPNVHLDWRTYALAANGYRKVGLFDKALSLLKKSEEIITSARRKTAFNFLLTQYAAIGKKEEVMRLWEIYRKEGKIYNKGYMAMIPAILKFDDFESAQKIYEEWESRKLFYDIRIPNILVGAYCRKGLLEAAETLVNRVILNGGEPDARTWYYFATGHLQHNNNLKAVEYMRKAISLLERWWRKERKDALAACLEYLKGEEDVKEAEEFISLLENKEIVSVDVQDRLMNWIKDRESSVHAIDILERDANKEATKLPEHEEDSSSDKS